MFKLLNEYFVLIAFLISFSGISLAQVGIGTTELENSAILEVKSADKGFLPPRLTANEKSLIDNPAEGLVVYCTNCCENGTLIFHNGATWVAPNSCPDYDLDLDGVPNAADLDDDNDGILDTEEGSETPIQSVPTALTNITQTMNNLHLSTGDVMVFENFLANVNGAPVDLRAQCIVVQNSGDDRAELVLNGVLPQMSFRRFDWKEHDHFVIRYTFVEHNSVSLGNLSGTPIDVQNVRIVFSDIESGPGNVSEIGGFGRGKLSDGSNVEPTMYGPKDISDTWVLFNAIFRGPAQNKPNYPFYNLITVDPAYAGTGAGLNNWNDEGIIGNTLDRGTGVINYDTLSSIELLFGVTGGSNGSANRGARMVIESFFELNTTNSGDVDFKNLDSDGDGCFDALEGGGGFTSNQIDGVGKLLGAVDVNGVPTLAVGGQTVGDARNDTVHTACP